MNRHRHLLVAFSLACAALLPGSAPAQYLYLDSNGDGVHTSADVLHGTGPTVIDIYLDTAHNKDGSPTTCVSSPSTPLTIFSYVVDLVATGGTVGWAAYTNRVTDMGPLGFAYPADSTHFSTGPFYTPTSLVLPAGKYRLGTLTVFPGSGTPSLQAVQGNDIAVFFDMTEFGSTCPGVEFANTIVLGSDWFDADGLPFEAGGGPDHGPRIIQPSDMSIASGGNAIQPISASDADGQPLSFAKVSGPSFLYVTTVDQGTGSARGEIRAAPFRSDAGTSQAAVRVSDGSATDQVSLQVTVPLGPDHPPFVAPPARVTVAAGSTTRVSLSAGDPDGGAVQFAAGPGPDFARLRPLAGRPGGASAVMTLAPSLCDIGSAEAAFSVTDGVSTVVRELAIQVVAPVNDTGIRHNAAGFVNALGLCDLDGDGKPDVIAAHEDQHLVSYYHGTGTGDFIFTNAFPVSGEDGGLATADFNGDGRTDIAVTDPADAGVDILIGTGDGTIRSSFFYATGTGPSSVRVADFNRDGLPDLVTNNQEAGTISVLLGRADGTFAARRDSPVGFRPNALAVGDFNLDGRTDVALAGPLPDGVGGLLTVLPGLGDGAFGDGIQASIAGYPFAMLSGDWDGDGRADLALTDIASPGGVWTYRGRGDGTFDPGRLVMQADPISFLFNLVTGDLDGDGNPDLVVSDIQFVRLAFLRGDGAGGFAPPAYLPNRFAAGLAIGDVNLDGRPDMVGSGPRLVDVFLNPFLAPASVEAAALVEGGQGLGTRKQGGLCVRVQAADPDRPASSRKPGEQLLVDPATVVLRSEGTGSVNEIRPMARKTVVVADADQDGAPEVELCFAAADVAALFDGLDHVTQVTPRLSGSLLDGRLFCTGLDMLAGGKGQSSEVVFAPNPLNPVSRLSFSTTRPGPARVRIYDPQGRQVRRLMEEPVLPAGPHEYRFDGRGDRGEKLPSSVYFYRVETTDGRFDGRIIILK